MTATEQPRVQKGVPTAGRWTATVHGEPAVSLAPARPAGLAGWPESLPVPTFDVAFGDDGQVKTQVNVHGGHIEVVTADRESKWITSTVSDSLEFEDPFVMTAAVEWAQRAHVQFEEKIRAEMERAAELARHRAAAEIMGVSTPLSTAAMKAVFEDAAHQRWTSAQDAERAAASLISRKILDRHPDAAYAEIELNWDDDGTEFISALTAYSSDGEQLEYLDNTGETTVDDLPVGELDEEVTDLMDYLEPGSVTAAFPFEGPHPGGRWIDLRKAADWAPGVKGNR